MRIASFLPSATEILFELGLDKEIVGVTHECLYPEKAKSKNTIIKPAYDYQNLNSKEINDTISSLSEKSQSVFSVDKNSIRLAKPDLIITQNTCYVCAPFENEIDKAIEILGYSPEVLVIQTNTLEDIFASIIDIAKRVDKKDKGHQLVNGLYDRIQKVKDFSEKGIQEQKQKILCIEWLSPIYTAGHWIPEMVELCGAKYLLSKKGDKSKIISYSDISQSDPDKIILMPCGYGIRKTLDDYRLIVNDDWKQLRAFKDNEIYAVDSDNYFSKPSPRIVVGIEILMTIINQDFAEIVQIPPASYSKIDNKLYQ